MSSLMIKILIMNKYSLPKSTALGGVLKLMRVPVLKQIILYYGSKDIYINKQCRKIGMWILDHQYGENQRWFQGNVSSEYSRIGRF